MRAGPSSPSQNRNRGASRVNRVSKEEEEAAAAEEETTTSSHHHPRKHHRLVEAVGAVVKEEGRVEVEEVGREVFAAKEKALVPIWVGLSPR